MPDIYGIMSVGSRALLTQQKAIDVTGQNIANVNTPGYSRQRVVMQASTPIAFTPGQMGTGVQAAEIQRIYDRFVGSQINTETQSLGRWEARESGLQRAELIFNESDGAGLSNALSEFWNAWQDLANNPTGYAERTGLLSKSETVARSFNSMADNLVQIQQDCDANISGTVEEINILARQIVDLNDKISQVEVAGQNSNDYRDQRDQLLVQLAEKIDIRTYEDNFGRVSVQIADGRPLVESPYAWQLGTVPNGDGHASVVWMNRDGTTADITDAIQGGQLKGWLEVRDGDVQGYLERLDELANGIMTEVNGLHSGGYGTSIDPFTGAPVTGVDFFIGSGAAGMLVNPAVAGDVGLIAAAGTAAGVPGDGSQAVAIAGLVQQPLMSAGAASFDDFYTSLVSAVGNDVRTASANCSYQGAMVKHLEDYRESVAGVNLDEEMINLVKFQHAYEAAAKLITTVDEMLETVMNMV
jgi:flagellar hook-associated protein 1 FlgK